MNIFIQKHRIYFFFCQLDCSFEYFHFLSEFKTNQRKPDLYGNRDYFLNRFTSGVPL